MSYLSRRWQYQEKAESLQPIEEISFDKWAPVYPNWFPPRRPLYAAALMKQQMLFGVPVTTAINIFINKIQHSEPARKATISIAAIAMYLAFVPLAEEVTIDKWSPVIPHRQVPKPSRCADLDQSIIDADLLTKPENPQIDKWEPRYPDRLPPAKSIARYMPASVIDPCILTQPEFPGADKWPPEYPDKVFTRPNFAYLVPSSQFNIVSEMILADKWLPTYPSLFPPPKSPISLFPSWQPIDPWILLQTGEQIRPDKWWPTYPDRFPEKSRLYAAALTKQAMLFEVPPVTVINIYIDKAARIYPVFQTPRIAACFLPAMAPIDPWQLTQPGVPPEEVGIDKWIPIYPERIYLKANPHPAYGRQLLCIEIPEPMLLKWLPRYPVDFYEKFELAHLHPAWQPIDPWILTQPEAVRVDKFLPTYPDRIYTRQVVAYLYPDWTVIDPWILTQSGAAAETILADKWLGRYPDILPPPKNISRFLQASAPIDPWLLTQTEAVGIDKFQPTYPDRIYRFRIAAHLYPNWQIVDSFLNFITYRCWPIYPDKIYAKRVLAHLHPAWQAIDPWLLTQTERIDIDKWMPVYPDLLFKGKRYVLKPVLVPEGWLGLTIVPAPYVALGYMPVIARFKPETEVETRFEEETAITARFKEEDIVIDLSE